MQTGAIVIGTFGLVQGIQIAAAEAVHLSFPYSVMAVGEGAAGGAVGITVGVSAGAIVAGGLYTIYRSLPRCEPEPETCDVE